MSSTRNTRLVNATPAKVYKAFTDPKALELWLVPGEMTGKIHSFDLRENGGYEMSLYYPETETPAHGKTGSNEDRYTARFLQLDPPKKIVTAVRFHSDDPGLSGEMLEHVLLEPKHDGTQVTIVFENIPKGIKAEDNKAGTESSLDKLQAYLQSHT